MLHTNDKHGCPRGFIFSKEKGECVPERSEVSDKLTQRYERYFFKEGDSTDPIKGKTDNVPACKDGYHW